MAEVHRVRASNSGPYTGPGTNTWLIDADTAWIVIDPGPDDPGHLAAIETRLGGKPVGVILVTHSHSDHLPLAAMLAERTGARVLRHPELSDGDRVTAGNLTVSALYTPGHCADHLAFWLESDRALFTGDLVLGHGSSMVTYPEGDVAAYLASLERIAGLRPRLLFPGHWDPVTDAEAKIEEYRTHRLQRERQVLEALAQGGGTAPEVARRVYGAEVGEELLAAAEMTLRAHLKKLVDEGRVRSIAAGGEIFELVR